MKLRPWRPTIDPATIPDAVLRSEWGRRTQAKRKSFGAGPGRPWKYPRKVIVVTQALESAPAPRMEAQRPQLPENQQLVALCSLCGAVKGANALGCYQCRLDRHCMARGGV